MAITLHHQRTAEDYGPLKDLRENKEVHFVVLGIRQHINIKSIMCVIYLKK